jgi:nitroimidazol reductase NimA-like FMN-containing flavoprotein (pyridoxamine 5'-phosphate oxidase superfamily)
MPGYGLPRGRDGLLAWSWAERRLRRSHNYWMVTTRPNGAPHAMPVWGIWVDSVYYFSTGRQSRKAKNLAKNARCVVCNEDAAEAVIVEGVAKEVKDAALIARLGVLYHAKYKPWKLKPEMGPIYAVRPRMVFAIAEAKSMKSATRWRFR